MLFLPLALILLNLSGYASVRQISKCSPSSGGTYNDVTEDYDKSSDIYYLYCEEPGDKTCKWTQYPMDSPTTTEYNDADKVVQEELAEDILSGSTVVDGNNVNWQATSQTCYSFNIDFK